MNKYGQAMFGVLVDKCEKTITEENERQTSTFEFLR